MSLTLAHSDFSIVPQGTMKKGYIKLWRKIRDNPLYKEKRRFNRNEAWIDLLLMATHKDGEVIVDFEKIPIKRGQILTSQLALSKKWNWGIASVNRFLKFLSKETFPELSSKSVKNGKQISYKTERKYTIISILNWDKYQVERKPKRKPKRKGERKPNGNQTETFNNVKECKRIIISYKRRIKEKEDIDLEISWDKAIRRISHLLNRKDSPLKVDFLEDLLTWYPDSEKAGRFGYGLMVALSADTINKFKAVHKEWSQMYAD